MGEDKGWRFNLGFNWKSLNYTDLASSEAEGKDSACQCKRPRRPRFNPWVRKIPWRRKWLLTPVFLPGEFHEWTTVHGVTKNQT